MKSVPKSLKMIVLAIMAALLLVQAIRIEKSNPPVCSDLASVAVKPVLQRGCYNCHSNETIWPWYSNVAPASWLVGMDVREGRNHLNFSEWGALDSGTRVHKLRSIAEEVHNDGMPPWYYSVVHRGSRLNKTEQNQILAWVTATIRQEMK
jgi:hypothetical protein